MAKDLKSARLTRIAQRIQAAQQSGGLLGVDQAVAKSIEELTDDINGQTEEQMQRLPLRITLLAMPFLLGPIVILFFYPLVDRILKTLSGTAIGGGFNLEGEHLCCLIRKASRNSAVRGRFGDRHRSRRCRRLGHPQQHVGTQGNGVATWIDSIAVPAAHRNLI
ncbi:MAG: hypothetical protein M0C28_30775 [Candidatus Moduliflexus flocculans]|nr:hypothetical protein [Candidatus Moduliflexus flocculans]